MATPVIPEDGVNPAPNSCRSDMGRSNLVRSNFSEPNSGIDKYNMLWRIIKTPEDTSTWHD